MAANQTNFLFDPLIKDVAKKARDKLVLNEDYLSAYDKQKYQQLYRLLDAITNSTLDDFTNHLYYDIEKLHKENSDIIASNSFLKDLMVLLPRIDESRRLIARHAFAEIIHYAKELPQLQPLSSNQSSQTLKNRQAFFNNECPSCIILSAFSTVDDSKNLHDTLWRSITDRVPDSFNYTKEIKYEKKSLTFTFKDALGVQDYDAMLNNLLKDAKVLIFLFDIDQNDAFEKLENLLCQAQPNKPNILPIFIAVSLQNKDLTHNEAKMKFLEITSNKYPIDNNFAAININDLDKAFNNIIIPVLFREEPVLNFGPINIKKA